jgi:hypothetical protein
MLSVLNDGEEEGIVVGTGELIMELCQTADLRRELLAKLDLPRFCQRICEAKTIRCYILFVRLAKTIASLSLEFDWIFQKQMLAQIFKVLDGGMLPEKRCTAQLVFMVLGLGTIEQVRMVYESGLANAVIEIIEASPEKELDIGLRAIARSFDAVNREGMKDWDSFNKFQDDLGQSLLRLLENSDEAIVKLARRVLEHHFPEIYYSS